MSIFLNSLECKERAREGQEEASEEKTITDYNMPNKFYKGGLTRKQKEFADRWIENGGNGTEAALETYDVKDKLSASQVATQNLQKLKIRSYIEGMAPGAASRIEELAKKAKNESVRLTANQDILNRAGFKPIDKSENKNFNVSISLSNLLDKAKDE